MEDEDEGIEEPRYVIVELNAGEGRGDGDSGGLLGGDAPAFEEGIALMVEVICEAGELRVCVFLHGGCTGALGFTSELNFHEVVRPMENSMNKHSSF